MTKRWTRSPRAKVFGVVAGFAEWRDLPVQETRLIVFLIMIFTSVFPGIIVYLLLALILPMQTPDDVISSYEPRSFSQRHSRNKADVEDAVFEEKNTDDLKKEYEELKRKVEEMESEMFDKEKDWDERFNSSSK